MEKKFKEDLKYRPSMRINQFNEINLEGEIYIGDFNYQDNTINFQSI